jgi:hypothetical protein
MQESIREYAEELRRSQGISLQIRVGLNSGEVAAGARGGDRAMIYSVNGQPVHLAARMEQLAMPGTILMAATTFGLTEGFLETRPLGSMAVKGLPAPVETYQLLRAGAVRSRLQVAASRGLTPFVGRLKGIAALKRARTQVLAGEGQLLAIVGEPGVGKSRLIHEFVRAEFDGGWRILEAGGGSVSYATRTTTLPIAELLRRFFQIAPSDDVPAIRQKVTSKLLGLDKTLLAALPVLLAQVDMPQEESASSRIMSAQPGRSAVQAIKQLLYYESAVQPLLVILEDLHTIDPDTQALLEGLMDDLPSVRVLLVASYRPEYRHGWGRQIVLHRDQDRSARYAGRARTARRSRRHR